MSLLPPALMSRNCLSLVIPFIDIVVTVVITVVIVVVVAEIVI